MRHNIELGGYVFGGYLIKMDSRTHNGIILATAEMADNPNEYGNEGLQSTGTIVHGSDNIGKRLAFRYDVIERGGVVDGIRKHDNRVLVDGEIMWEVRRGMGSEGQVIGVQEGDGWVSQGRHVVMKQVAKPALFVSKWLVAPGVEDLPDPWEKDKFEVAWPNEWFPVGCKLGVQLGMESPIQVDGQLLFYIPQDYVLFTYND